VGVAYREDVDEVMVILKEVGTGLRQDPEFAADILDDLEVVGVDDFAASQVTIKIRIKTVPIKQWRIGRELRRRIKKAFDARGIEIPFPHLTLYFGAPKHGTARPLHVTFDSQPPQVHVGQEHHAEREEL
jgi:small conductance mechanosensitive channel